MVFINTNMRGHSGCKLYFNTFQLCVKSNLSKEIQWKDQFESCPANLVHLSDSLAISLKAKQKYHGATQGPDLDFTR